MREKMKDGFIIDDYGTKFWYKNGKLHRVGGPAIECTNGTKHWFVNGEYHRLDGPASVWYDGYKHWWLYGKKYPESEYNSLVSNLPLLYWNRFKLGKWI